ncbi:MAG: response regulator [Alphaproteobacteria bacterium]|jgi:DNA-binding response OmpR family regulator|nr:response regulator [Alphaproteobacteria bacterium]|tara:strand:- start:158 stop:1024 length:867 start_codon:yes stop_codon:yes gene_type:complete
MSAIEQGSGSAQGAVGTQYQVCLHIDDAGRAEQVGAVLERFGYAVDWADEPGTLTAAGAGPDRAAEIVDIAEHAAIARVVESLNRLAQGGGVATPTIVVGDIDDLELRLAALRSAAAYLRRPLKSVALIDMLDRITAPEAVQPRRVLIVDDSGITSKIHAKFLRQADLEVEVVNDPLAAMGPLASFEPDLILMDLEMPDCSGTELAGLIRQQPEYDGIPIIFLSGEGDLGRQFDAMRFGGEDFLTKPIKEAQLVRAVTAHVRRSRILRRRLDGDASTGGGDRGVSIRS